MGTLLRRRTCAASSLSIWRADLLRCFGKSEERPFGPAAKRGRKEYQGRGTEIILCLWNIVDTSTVRRLSFRPLPRNVFVGNSGFGALPVIRQPSQHNAYCSGHGVSAFGRFLMGTIVRIETSKRVGSGPPR